MSQYGGSAATLNRVCTTLTFSSVVASFHCAIRRRLFPKGFHEGFMNFHGRHSFLTEELDDRSDFKFLHFANLAHPPLLYPYSTQAPDPTN